MNRVEFLRRCALITAGVVAADQIELLEKLTWKRRFFPSGDVAEMGHWEIPAGSFRAATIPDGGYECVMGTPAPICVPGPRRLVLPT